MLAVLLMVSASRQARSGTLGMLKIIGIASVTTGTGFGGFDAWGWLGL